jgi:hypothetical protein
MTPLALTAPTPAESEIDLTQARAALGKMTDLERRTLHQGAAQQMVHSPEGYLFQVPFSLPYQQPDAEAWSPAQPQSALIGMATPPQFLGPRTRALMRRIEGAEAGMAPFGFPPENGGFFRGIGFAAGIEPVRNFQPVWDGSHWRVKGGTLSYPRLNADGATWQQVSLFIEDARLELAQGWIAVSIIVQPETLRHPQMPASGYDVAVLGIIATEVLENVHPTRTTSSTGVNGRGDYEAVITWSSGRYMLPLAYVAAPGADGNAAPRVAHLRSHIAFMLAHWQGGLPDTILV